MMLSRGRRVATGVAAGVIVMCAALIGASFRDNGAGVSVAAEVRPDNVVAIEIDPENTGQIEDRDDSGTVGVEIDADDAVDAADPASDPDTDSDVDTNAGTDSDPVQVIEPEDLPDATDTQPADPDASSDTGSEDSDATSPTADATDTTETAETNDTEAESTGDSTATDDTAADEPNEAVADTTSTNGAADPADTGAAEPADTTAPVDSGTANLGTGGGVDDAECALDRLVIYAGARRSGVAGSMRSALAQAGFGAGCAGPVTVLASNCPLQFAGVLAAGSGYDPNKSFVAASDSVDRETMTAVLGQIGYAGSAIDILDFGFVNPDKPGEQWVAVFIPPSFSGWENLSNRAGLSPTSQGLCSASGNFAG